MKLGSNVLTKIRKIFSKSKQDRDIPVRGLTFAVRNPKTGRKEIRVADGLHPTSSCPTVHSFEDNKSPTTIDQL